MPTFTDDINCETCGVDDCTYYEIALERCKCSSWTPYTRRDVALQEERIKELEHELEKQRCALLVPGKECVQTQNCDNKVRELKEKVAELEAIKSARDDWFDTMIEDCKSVGAFGYHTLIEMFNAEREKLAAARRLTDEVINTPDWRDDITWDHWLRLDELLGSTGEKPAPNAGPVLKMKIMGDPVTGGKSTAQVPEPDGKAGSPSVLDKCRACNHSRGFHSAFLQEDTHCNHVGCNCLQFKEGDDT
jgi:hypothetical protein